MPEIDCYLEKMMSTDASDLHIKSGAKPRYRLNGELEESSEFGVLSRIEIDRMIFEVLTREQKAQCTKLHDFDFAYGDVETARYRCNYFQDYHGSAAVFRRIPALIPTLAELNLPQELATFAHMRSGLVLVTGCTGSGKTSTLAAIINVINHTYRKHIITLEDPIEYIYTSRKSVIHQRGLYDDIVDFQSGVVAALREDPDVLLEGEMRDLDTIRLALTASEVGTLVFATLHTNSSADSIDRIIDVFDSLEQPRVRAMLSQSLAGIVSQVLLRRTDRSGRIPATEILIASPAVSHLIRDGKSHDIINVIQGGKEQGMHTMDDSLLRLVERRVVDPTFAYRLARSKARFEKFVTHSATAPAF